MFSPSPNERSTKFSSKRRHSFIYTALIISVTGLMSDDLAAAIYSAHIDRAEQKIILRGSGFTPSTAVTLGGISVTTAPVSATELEIPFATEVYTAVQWQGSYNLIVDGLERISVYIDSPILAPPPPGGPDCPCIAGWEAAGLTPDSFLCSDLTDGTQTIVYGNSFDGFNRFIAAAFDPNNIYYDPSNPDTATSFCALSENNVYTVTEPVVNQDQYSDCYNWIHVRSSICLF